MFCIDTNKNETQNTFTHVHDVTGAVTVMSGQASCDWPNWAV